MRWVAFAVGFLIVGGTVVSAIRTVILPRAAQDAVTGPGGVGGQPSSL